MEIASSATTIDFQKRRARCSNLLLLTHKSWTLRFFFASESSPLSTSLPIFISLSYISLKSLSKISLKSLSSIRTFYVFTSRDLFSKFSLSLSVKSQNKNIHSQYKEYMKMFVYQILIKSLPKISLSLSGWWPDYNRVSCCWFCFDRKGTTCDLVVLENTPGIWNVSLNYYCWYLLSFSCYTEWIFIHLC